MSVTIINKQVNLDAAKRELISGALPDGSVLVTGKRQYTIQGVLGAGGFGIAYRATAPVKTADGYISRTFAIKEYFKKGCFRGDNGTTMRFAPNMTTEMNTGLKDFLTEAKRLKEISGLSANIVYVDEVFEANDTAYYAMEYLDGGDLERRVKHNGALSEGIALSLLIPIAKAVALLHEKHLLHLDIKPDNIVMKNEDDGSQHPVLIDFGIAKHFDKKGKPTSNLVAKGATDGYAPMEQYTDITTFAPEIDVYALGATLYFLLSGKQPPKSFDITPEIIEQNLPESVSARTRAAIVHALNRMKERRTPTVAAFLSELRTTYTLPLGYVLSTPEGAFRILEVTGETDCSIRYRAIPASAGAIDGALPRQPRGGKATDTIQGAVVIDELYIKGSQRADDGIFLPETDRWLNHFDHSTGPFPPPEVFAFIKMVDDATAAGDGVITANANGTRYLIRKPTAKPSPAAKITSSITGIGRKWKKVGIVAAIAAIIVGGVTFAVHSLTSSSNESIAKQVSLAKMYYDKEDYSKAVELFKLTAEQGNAEAQNGLGHCYCEGLGVKQDYAEAVKWFKKAAEQGYAKAQTNLGLCYEFGQGLKQDYTEAVKWYGKAADQGYDAAQYCLGVCYYRGNGVEGNFSQAVEWLTKAAEQGLAAAQRQLGICHQYGEGVKKDTQKAVEWYTKAAEQGDADAQFYLSCCYINGEGVKRDVQKYVEWLTKAAEQGHANAQYNLGCCYKDGIGVKQSYKKTVEWYTKAAEQGYAWAQYNLGCCYEDGLSVTKDKAKAIEWYKKAAEQNDEYAIDALKRLGVKM